MPATSLSQVCGFVTESGGHVWIDSKIGQGTTVRLYLPTCAERQRINESRPAGTIPASGGGGTVLVVDDDESVLETVKETVADLGYRVLSAHNGPETLQILKDSRTWIFCFRTS